jgi:flavin reductase (DIM6/NTAB) family NADH-FMN oxidoreductase RutF
MDIDPDALGARERYRLLIGCIVPRPIALVSTLSPDGRPNLAPFSFFNGVGSDPLTVLFCPSNRPDGGEKDTLRNCKPLAEGGTGEFVVSASVEGYAREIAACAEELPYGTSEFELTGLATAPSLLVKPPRVARAPWAFECQTLQVVRTNPGRPAGGNVVIGRILRIHIDDDLVDSRLVVDSARLAAVGRLGGISYCLTRQRYDMPPGREALTRPAPTLPAP